MAQTRPNILWLMTDEQRTDSLGAYGSPWAHTPCLDALAREGVLFQNAITPSPVCVPARTSVLAGQYPVHTGVWHNHLDLKQPVPNLMATFCEAGYQTASLGKQHYVGAEPAFETQVGRTLSSHVHYYHYNEPHDEAAFDIIKYPGPYYPWIFGGRFPADASQRSEAQVVDMGVDWLRSRDPERPFFLRISFNGPHTPVVPPEPFDTMIAAERIRFSQDNEPPPSSQPGWLQALGKASSASRLSAGQIAKMRQYYYGEVAFLDSQFDRLLDWMQSQQLLEDTIVVYLSDHGTHLGDHGLVQKQTFYDPVVRVPYFFWWPKRVIKGTTAKAPVSTQTLLPTLLDLTGLAVPQLRDASSLLDVLVSGREPASEPVFSELTLESFRPHVDHDGRLVMALLGDWKLSLCLDPEPHDHVLYNLAQDPNETENLAQDTRHRDILNRLLEIILEHMREAVRL